MANHSETSSKTSASNGPYAVRFRGDLRQRIDRYLDDRGGGSIADLVNEAVEQFIATKRQETSLEEFERKVGDTVGRLAREVRSQNNSVQFLMAFFDCYVRSYLLHTPSVPNDALDAQASSAHERYRKLMDQVPKALSNSEGITAVIAALRQSGVLV